MEESVPQTIAVSKCLIGENCRYDGKNNLVPEIKKLFDDGLAVAVCPEQLGGLPTPRVPCERCGDTVVSREGADVTAEYHAGAEAALRIAQKYGCRTAILKARSPSCGKGCIYSGDFNGHLVEGNGVTAELFLCSGISVMTEEEFLSESWEL